MALVRASSLDLLWECSASFVEPNIQSKAMADRQYPKAQESQAWGNMVHKWKETDKISHKDKKKEKLLRRRISDNKIDRYKYWPLGGHHEVNVAYNWVYRFSVLSFKSNPNAFRDMFDDEWVTGTIDYLNLNTFTVDDLKTGQWWDKAPDESIQVLFYGLGVYRSGIEEPLKLSVTHWPKYPAKKPPKVTKSVIVPEQFEKFERKLIKKLKVVYDKKVEYNPSPSTCRFCPNRFSCQEAELGE